MMRTLLWRSHIHHTVPADGGHMERVLNVVALNRSVDLDFPWTAATQREQVWEMLETFSALRHLQMDAGPYLGGGGR